MVNALKTIGWRLMRFRLRTLLVVVSLVAVLFGYWIVPARRQARAVQALAALGAEMRYDFQSILIWMPEFGGRRPSPPPGPKFIREYLGVDYLSGIDAVDVPRVWLTFDPKIPIGSPSGMRDDDYRHLADLKHLMYLSVDGGPLSDKAMPHIGRARTLLSIRLWLDREPPLKDATLPPQGISDLGLRSISRLRKLEDLLIRNPTSGLRAPAITDDGLASLAGLINLEALYLENTEIRGPGLRHLSQLKRLRGIRIKSAPLGNDGLAQLASCDRLESIGLAETGITDDGLKHLADVRSLMSISLQHNKLTDAGMAHLSHLPKLSYVQLEGNGITDAGLEALAQTPAIAKIDLAEPQITDEGLAALARLTKLEHLQLIRTSITGPGLRYLRELPNLKLLTVDTAPLGDDGLEHFAHYPQLTELRLFRTKITDAGLVQLAKLTALQLLMIDGDRLTDDAMRKLTRELPNCKVQYQFKNPQAAGTGPGQNP
jgi:hypothetical protein